MFPLANLAEVDYATSEYRICEFHRAAHKLRPSKSNEAAAERGQPEVDLRTSELRLPKASHTSREICLNEADPSAREVRAEDPAN
jgi:hypothetical protein